MFDQVPAVRDRIAGIAAAREGMAAVERSPLGQLAEKKLDLKRAIGVLFDRDPLAGGEREIGATNRAAIMQAAAMAAKAHQERFGGTWSEALSVCLTAVWDAAKLARYMAAH